MSSKHKQIGNFIHGLIGFGFGFTTSYIGLKQLLAKRPLLQVEGHLPSIEAETEKEQFDVEAKKDEMTGGMSLSVQSDAPEATIRSIIKLQMAISIAAYRQIFRLGGAELKSQNLEGDLYKINIKHDEDDETWAIMVGAVMRQRDILLARKKSKPEDEKTPGYWTHLANEELVRSSRIAVCDQDTAGEFMGHVLSSMAYLAICLERFGVVEPPDFFLP